MRTVYINKLHFETRIAVTEEERLVEYMVEDQQTDSSVGSIYYGQVENVLPGMEAAFINIGLEKNAFLYVDDILPALNDGVPKDKPSIQSLLKKGDFILVQVAKDPIGDKGAKLTTQFHIPGKYVVYMPYGEHIGISRKIEGTEERERLKEIGVRFIQGQEGLIIRTVCAHVSEEAIIQDIEELRARWVHICTRQALLESEQKVSLIYKEGDVISKTTRDLLNDDLSACIVDDQEIFQRLQQEAGDELQDKLLLYTESQQMFDYYNLTPDIEKALRRKLWLKSGGYLVIDHTEALTTIDVNTGKYVGKQTLAETVLHTNLEAVKEIARQLRLRDIGGIVIVDFIDMEDQKHQQLVLQALENEVKSDRTKTKVVGLTALGLIEITRKKMRRSLAQVYYTRCQCCDGTGIHIAPARLISKVEQILWEYSRQGIEAVIIQVEPLLLHQWQRESRKWEQLEGHYGIKLFFSLWKTHSTSDDRFKIAFSGSVEKVTKQAERYQAKRI